MSKSKFKKAVSMFQSEFTSWCNKRIEKTDGDYDAVTAEICQIMSEKFHTTTESLRSVAIELLPESIEEIVVELSKEGNYFFSKQSSDSTDNTWWRAEWILKKKGGTRELKLELSNENYIHVCGNTWNLFAYSFNTLRSAIRCWAKDEM